MRSRRDTRRRSAQGYPRRRPNTPLLSRVTSRLRVGRRRLDHFHRRTSAADRDDRQRRVEEAALAHAQRRRRESRARGDRGHEGSDASSARVEHGGHHLTGAGGGHLRQDAAVDAGFGGGSLRAGLLAAGEWRRRSAKAYPGRPRGARSRRARRGPSPSTLSTPGSARRDVRLQRAGAESVVVPAALRAVFFGACLATGSPLVVKFRGAGHEASPFTTDYCSETAAPAGHCCRGRRRICSAGLVPAPHRQSASAGSGANEV